MASTRTQRAVSFDVCGLDDPKIEHVKTVENNKKPGQLSLNENGLKGVSSKFEFKNGFPSIARRRKEDDSVSIKCMEVKHFLLSMQHKHYIFVPFNTETRSLNYLFFFFFCHFYTFIKSSNQIEQKQKLSFFLSCLVRKKWKITL